MTPRPTTPDAAAPRSAPGLQDHESARAARRAEMTRSIREALERLFAAGHVYTDLGVNEIVAEAGIPRSTFYVYFADRSDMLREVYLQSWRTLGRATQPWWDLDGAADRAAVRAVMAALVWTYRPHMAVMAAVHDAAAYDPAVRELVDRLMSRSIAAATEHLQRGQREGFVNPDLPPGPTAAWIIHMCERSMHRYVRTLDPSEVDPAVEAITEIVWRTLYAPARD
ncbi:MAG: TetR/AcrR family transcriptional regulator [Solirubrobacteraceae bacterium]|nr:TetR/AcrR family transcriptional regulator [Solirubrobacteraceae bacterium]